MLHELLLKYCKIVFGCAFLLAIGLVSCSDDRSYSFFVAGHVYGSPSSDSIGLYPKFVETFDKLNADELMVQGFLTGDIVKNPSEESWNRVDSDLRELSMPVAFAPGNHDLKDYDLYKRRYGQIGHYFFIEDDLFVIPEVQMDGWVISTDQLDFFTELVEANKGRIEHVFIFVHQVIFMDYVPLIPNSSEGKSEALNFEAEVLPVIENTNIPTYIFTGDIGAFDWGTPVFHERVNNVTYIGSGMGGGKADNYIVVDVLKDKSVAFRIVSLNNVDLGKIDDY